MPLQNRVRPDGEIIAVASRGMFMGNRGGRLHREDRQLGSRRWAGKAWICCRTQFRDRRRQVMGPGYTELFFLDEATALAAGHRPCFECRREDATRFAGLWNEVRGLPGRALATQMDDVLHAQRLMPDGSKRVHRQTSDSLPDGVILTVSGRMALSHSGLLWPWTPAGYLAPMPFQSGCYDVLTPPAIIAILGAGYRPVLHGSKSSPASASRD